MSKASSEGCVHTGEMMEGIRRDGIKEIRGYGNVCERDLRVVSNSQVRSIWR